MRHNVNSSRLFRRSSAGRQESRTGFVMINLISPITVTNNDKITWLARAWRMKYFSCE